MRTHAISVTSLALAVLLAVGGPAVAASDRGWVSGHGVDQAGCGVPSAPCRSLQYAHDHAVNAGGEIDILDPAGYGALTITKSISIVNDGVGTAGVQTTSGNAITVIAGASDSVFLRGLNIDGDMMSGSSGIAFHTGASLTVTNCVIRHFLAQGILLQPTSPTANFLIKDTITSDNGNAGIYLGGVHWSSTSVIRALIDHVTSVNNQYGLYSFTLNDSAVPSLGLSNCNLGNNAQDGVSVIGGSYNVHSCQISFNGANGVEASGQAFVTVSRSDIELNLTDNLYNNDQGCNCFQTFGDNVYQSAGGQPLTLSNLR